MAPFRCRFDAAGLGLDVAAVQRLADMSAEERARATGPETHG